MAQPAVIRCALLDRAAALDALWIWREAAQWLLDRGLPLWQPSIFDECFVDDSLALGPIVGASIAGGLAGVALLHWTDDVWWPDRPAGEAGYVHKIAVARAFAGRGVVTALIGECERRTREHGRSRIRLDTAADRPVLRALYERHGFAAVDLRYAASFHGVRYEKRL
jgi:ribosomal protein S18 acetylase RimI-like enzyme